ncbi:MAG: 1-deoxy-D-xylulose-5-phosphate reductoisomerase [Oscillospiraceae bacterium]|nr:1-deoxy-D-xylulose-5-phosphate reductoisomerase [Oscillospiraceae bacterium]
MSKRISILGSTGSIGRQSLDVIAACGMEAAALTANSNAARMEEQVRQFKPELAVMMDERAAADLRVRLADTPVRVAAGMEGLLEAAELPSADTVLTAVVGMIGLRPTMAAIREGKRIALANKETLVCAGQLVMEEARDFGAEILPVDSEHSALFQSLQGCRDRGEVRRLILTCSGGPFFGKTRTELQGVTRKDALQHPNWSMGTKITIDSATLMNKGLEFIEAMHLYQMSPEKISIVIHRESIIHSLVEYCDHGMIAQLGVPDMRLPIQYALTWPRRTGGPADPLDLCSCGPLTFAQPDLDTFRCLELALKAARTGGTAGAVLNGANEAAVALFLEDRIGFLEIADRVALALDRVPVIQEPSMTQILEADQAAREAVLSV